MTADFISFINNLNIYLSNSSQAVGEKYNFDYTLEDVKKIASPIDSKGNKKGEPDLKFLRAYDFALSIKRNNDQIIKTPQDYYTQHIFENEERISQNNKVLEYFMSAKKPV